MLQVPHHRGLKEQRGLGLLLKLVVLKIQHAQLAAHPVRQRHQLLDAQLSIPKLQADQRGKRARLSQRRQARGPQRIIEVVAIGVVGVLGPGAEHELLKPRKAVGLGEQRDVLLLEPVILQAKPEQRGGELMIQQQLELRGAQVAALKLQALKIGQRSEPVEQRGEHGVGEREVAQVQVAQGGQDVGAKQRAKAALAPKLERVKLQAVKLAPAVQVEQLLPLRERERVLAKGHAPRQAQDRIIALKHALTAHHQALDPARVRAAQAVGPGAHLLAAVGQHEPSELGVIGPARQQRGQLIPARRRGPVEETSQVPEIMGGGHG